MKLELIPIKEPKTADHIVQLIHGLIDVAYRDDIKYLGIEYKIDDEIYRYSVGKK